MQLVECSGSPYQIGYQHGSVASAAVARSVEFYAGVFKESCNLTWDEALENSRKFAVTIRDKWPQYYEEMRGVADGSARELIEIVALNVRTELAFGQMSDGCTSAYLQSSGSFALLGQNWDVIYGILIESNALVQWMPAQAPNILIMTISQPSFPTIKMVTEAGLIGKIGINSSGVGVCFNALRIRGVSPGQIPAHLALRRALESRSAAQAASAIGAAGGLASSAYILVGDIDGAIGLECTSKTVARQTQTEAGTVVHANHLLYPSAHPKSHEDENWIRDSTARVQRMNSLLTQFLQPMKAGSRRRIPSAEGFGKLFEDEAGYPMSICRANEGASNSASLFNIVMDLERKTAVVREGRPCDKGREHVLNFDKELGISARL